MNALKRSQRSLSERISLLGVRAVGIYLDTAPDATVRRNLILGTTNSTYWRNATTVGAGIALNNENYHYPVGGGSLSTSVQAKRAKIYDNLVAYTSTGIAMWGQLAESSFDGTVIYNNTLVDNNTQFSIIGKPQPSSKFVNNILLSLSSGDYSNAGNKYTGLALAKMSGWRSISSRTQVSWRDFVLAIGSTAINAGNEEPRSSADATNSYDLDHNAAAHNTPMDMGGLTFSTTTKPRPMAPTALTGT
jgi:hypothetical protein